MSIESKAKKIILFYQGARYRTIEVFSFHYICNGKPLWGYEQDGDIGFMFSKAQIGCCEATGYARLESG